VIKLREGAAVQIANAPANATPTKPALNDAPQKKG